MLAEDGGHLALLESAFDTNYAWPLKDLWNAMGSNYATANDFRRTMESTAIQYTDGLYQMVFIDNHDENTWHGTVFDRMGANVKNMAVLSFTVPGMPLIYSGNEFGLDRQLAFFEKDPIQLPESADWGKSDWEVFYKKLVELKTSNPALWTAGAGGPLVPLHEDDSPVIAFGRTYQINDVVVLMNLSAEEQTQKLNLGEFSGPFQNFFDGSKYELKPEVTLAGNSFLILTRKQ